MPKYFPGVTHSLVFNTITKEDMAAMADTISIVTLCFGSDEDKFLPIRIKKMPGPTSGVTAEIPQSAIVYRGKKIYTPVLKGKLADEAKLLALVAFDRVKQQFGIKFGKKFRVLAKTVEEIEGEASKATT